MRCPKCSYISFDDQTTCVKCKLQLDGKNALPFQGTAIRAESILYIRALPAAEEAPDFEPAAEEPYEDSSADLYRQLEAEGMGAGLAGQSDTEEFELSLADAAGDNESLLMEELSQPLAASSAPEPAFDPGAEEEAPSQELQAQEDVLDLLVEEEPPPLELQAEEEIPQFKLQAEEEVLSFESQFEEDHPLELQAEEEIHSLDLHDAEEILHDEEEGISLELTPENEIHSHEPQVEETPMEILHDEEEGISLELTPEDEIHSHEPQVEETPMAEFSDFRPEIDDGEFGSEPDTMPAEFAEEPRGLPSQEEVESTPAFPETVLEEMDLFDLEADEKPEQAESDSYGPRSSPGDSIFDLSDLMGNESSAPDDGPSIADNADMLLDLTFDGETEGAGNEVGVDSRLTEEDELDLGLDLDDDEKEL